MLSGDSNVKSLFSVVCLLGSDVVCSTSYLVDGNRFHEPLFIPLSLKEASSFSGRESCWTAGVSSGMIYAFLGVVSCIVPAFSQDTDFAVNWLDANLETVGYSLGSCRPEALYYSCIKLV